LLGTAAVTGALVLAGAGMSSAQSSSLPTISLTTGSSGIAVSGTLQSGAVNLVLSSTTGKASEPTVVRLNAGVSVADIIAALPSIQDPNDVTPYGAIVVDAEAPKKGSTTLQTVLQPGTYFVLDTAGNPAKGARGSFTIAASASPAALPKADATIRAIEFGFKAPKKLKAGSTVRVENDGWLVHMVAGLGVKNKQAARRLNAALVAGKNRAAQKLATGFVSFLDPASHGALQQFKLTAKPGYYVLACFMTTQDGREHTRLGMVKTIRVTR
jgi:hypothetical protein